jgi:integrase
VPTPRRSSPRSRNLSKAGTGLPSSRRPALRLVGNPAPAQPDPLADFLAGYTAPGTITAYKSKIDSLTAAAGPLDQLTEHAVIAWACQRHLANNTIRGRITAALTYLTFTNARGITAVPLDRLRTMKRQFPKTYGKVQSRNPGRWLTHDEAFGQLIDATNDGTIAGTRDEVAIRLGLAGMRIAEIAALTLGNIDRHSRTITWTGKRRKPRKVAVSSNFLSCLDRWLTAYAAAVQLSDDLPLICPSQWHHPDRSRIIFGQPAHPDTIRRSIMRAARLAGLGHVAPHDLRRSAAGILHRATTDDGAHRFDLLDIQKVLGHADPATTMRSYLDPMDTGVLDRAATFLD